MCSLPPCLQARRKTISSDREGPISGSGMVLEKGRGKGGGGYGVFSVVLRNHARATGFCSMGLSDNYDHAFRGSPFPVSHERAHVSAERLAIEDARP